MNNKALTIVISLIAGIVIGSFLPASARIGTMMSGRSGLSGQENSRVASGIDKHFIEQMIPHHDGAIEMSRIALERSSKPEIRQLAEAIIAAQTQENEQMRAWYRSWYGQDITTGNFSSGGMMSGGGMHMGGGQDLDTLRRAEDFDREFIEQMIPHHQMAIMMARGIWYLG